jgi:hypothetical protein
MDGCRSVSVFYAAQDLWIDAEIPVTTQHKFLWMYAKVPVTTQHKCPWMDAELPVTTHAAQDLWMDTGMPVTTQHNCLIVCRRAAQLSMIVCRLACDYAAQDQWIDAEMPLQTELHCWKQKYLWHLIAQAIIIRAETHYHKWKNIMAPAPPPPPRDQRYLERLDKKNELKFSYRQSVGWESGGGNE